MTTILHITDIHFGYDENVSAQAKRKNCLDAMLKVIKKLEPEWRPSIICITGDLVWRGLASDYTEAKAWIDRLLEICGLGYEKVVICVGNHEVNRKIAAKIPRPSTSLEADVALSPPIADHYKSIFSEFSNFCETCGIPRLKFGEYESSLVGARIVDGIQFVVLNSAWSSKDNHDKGKLWLGYPHVEYMQAQGQLSILSENQDGPITATLVHHPSDHLHEDEKSATIGRPNPWDYIASRSHILLTGHTHGEVRKPDQIADSAHHFTGGATYAGGNYTNSFRILKLKENDLIYKSFEYDPRSAENEWKGHDVRSVPLLKKKIQESQASFKINVVASNNELRATLCADALRQQDRKSRLLRPTGRLPTNVPQEVSVRVSPQHEQFDLQGKLLRQERTEKLMPLYEAIRESRRTLVLGDLGTGKSTLAAQLVLETMNRAQNALAVLIPVKNLELGDRLSPRDILQRITQYLVNETFPRDPGIDLLSLLENHLEVLLVFDGIDELPREVASRLLRHAATLTEHWPTIQIVATARPVELRGVSFAEWRVVHTAPLDDSKKLQFLEEELIADGVETDKAKQKAKELLHSLKNVPALDSLTSSPLAIRLIYPKIATGAMNPSLTLGDLLYELLLLRLGNWQQLDDKSSTFRHFESVFPAPEARIDFLATLAQKEVAGLHVSRDEAIASLTEMASHIPNCNKFTLATEALNYYEWLGLIVITNEVEFPLQSLAEMATAADLVQKWKYSPECELSNKFPWRVASFAVAIARKRGWLDDVRNHVQEYLKTLLTPESPNLPAACYIVAEAGDAMLAKLAIQLFTSLGMRPLRLFFDDQKTSAQNVAKTLWLAGENGFSYLFQQYLDPKHPLPNAGSRVINEVFQRWALLAHGHLSFDQKRQLKTLVAPYLATGEANFFGILDILAILVPEAFDGQDRLWYQSAAFDQHEFEEWVIDQFSILSTHPQQRGPLNEIILARSNNSERAAEFWLSLNPDKIPPIQIIHSAFRSLIRSEQTSLTSLAAECQKRIGSERWIRLARWLLTAEDKNIAAGAAFTLYDIGERRLPLLGDILLRSLHDGGYIHKAEILLRDLVDANLTVGMRWLASEIAERKEFLGAHSGWWRILLPRLETLPDAPELLANCVSNLGPFTLPRYPEVREAFAVLLNGRRGDEYKEVLRRNLNSLDPRQRQGAAKILLVTDPSSEGEALFAVVHARSRWLNHDDHEWESFCLSLNFPPGALTLLQSRLHLLGPNSTTFALALLVKGGIEIEDSSHASFLSGLLDLGNSHLTQDFSIRSYLKSDNAKSFLLAKLDQPESKASERAAQLLQNVFSPLSPDLEAKYILLCNTSSMWSQNLAAIMIRIAEDMQYARTLLDACKTIRQKRPHSTLLELVINACHASATWKDVLWSMFCDDRELGRNADDLSGPAILEFGLRVEKHRQALGKAALACLADARMQNYRWVDSYQWLAVIADEFSGLTPEQLRNALQHGQPIYCAAAAALIARLGEVPKNLQFDRAERKRHNLPVTSDNQTADESHIFGNLLEYGRDSENLHPRTLETIEAMLLCPEIDAHTLDQIANKGRPGILIAVAIRFCCGYTQNLRDTVPLLDFDFWRSKDHKKDVNRLSEIWVTARDLALRYDNIIAQEYLTELDRQLRLGNIWRLTLALQVLRVRRHLLPEQVLDIFLEYAKYSSFLHESLCAELVTWLCGELDEKTSNAVLDATHAALTELNNFRWGEDDNSLGCCLFPIIHWALGGEQSALAESVFLRGLHDALAQQPSPKKLNWGISKILSLLEPLFRRVPAPILRKTVQAGLKTPEPSLRAFCSLIESFDEKKT